MPMANAPFSIHSAILSLLTPPDGMRVACGIGPLMSLMNDEPSMPPGNTFATSTPLFIAVTISAAVAPPRGQGGWFRVAGAETSESNAALTADGAQRRVGDWH